MYASPMKGILMTIEPRTGVVVTKMKISTTMILHAEIVEVEIEVVSPSIVPSGNFAELNRTVTCGVLKANDRRTFCPCHDEFCGPRSDYVTQMQLSEVIARTRKYFREVTGVASENMVAQQVSPTTIATKLEYHKIKTDNEEVKKWLENMDYDRKGLMNMFCWSGLVDLNFVMSDLFKVPNLQSGRMEPIITALNPDEEEMFQNMMRRLHHIARVLTFSLLN
ncbi:proline dehydrogenase 1, mitochondrial [Trichonephila clavipes]|nr:proline dehydrogenase 1, mitochondrial [Trichonephila clavipes]